MEVEEIPDEEPTGSRIPRLEHEQAVCHETRGALVSNVPDYQLAEAWGPQDIQILPPNGPPLRPSSRCRPGSGSSSTTIRGKSPPEREFTAAEVTSKIGSPFLRVMKSVRGGISRVLKVFSTPGGGTSRIHSITLMRNPMPSSHARSTCGHSAASKHGSTRTANSRHPPRRDKSILQGFKPHPHGPCSPPTPEQRFGAPSNAGISWYQPNPIKEVSLKPQTAFDQPCDNRALHEGNREFERRGDPIETGLVVALTHLQSQPNFLEVVSTTNNWGQSLAHLSIIHSYPYLLSRLVGWHINLAIADANGLTALHYAYMKGDLESVRILRKGGAPDNVVDELGRKPTDLLWLSYRH